MHNAHLTRTAMDDAVLQQVIIRFAKDDAFLEIIRDQVKAAVKEAVDEAVAARDAEIESLREELADTKAQLNSLEQYSRRLCLDVSGVPETANEDTDRLVMDTARLAGIEITKNDIDRSHRVGAVKPGKPRTLIVRFASYAKREALYDARKRLRQPRPFEGSTVSADVAGHVFITDNLTRENQYILYKARQYRKEGKVYAAWSDVGKLKVRLREGSSTTVIRSLGDLTKLVEGAPPAGGAGRRGPATATVTDSGYKRVTRGSNKAK